MVKKEDLLGKSYKKIIPRALMWAVPISVLSLSSSYLLAVLRISSVRQMVFDSSFLLREMLLTTGLVVMFLILFMYLGIKSTARKVPMKDYDTRLTFSIWLLIFVWALNTLATSLIVRQFTLSGVGFITLVVGFVFPAVYKPK
ncbi:MAG: hypothetical protein KJ709_09725 [Nanoarchaeota archaeon]|nr:hypothetical protein [Nanoarchaeota archaeon]